MKPENTSTKKNRNPLGSQKSMKYFQVILASLILTGCASGTKFLSKAPNLTDKTKAALVNVYRPSVYAITAKNVVAVDGVELFEIAAFTTVQFYVDPGKHTLTATCFLFPVNKEDSLVFHASAGGTYYFQVGTLNPYGKCSSVGEGDEVTAFNKSDSIVKFTN